MTRLQEEVWTVEAEARTDSVLRAARCHPRRRVPRQPGWDEEACGGVGGDGGHLSSPPSIPLSFTDLYLASSFFSSRPLFWGSRLRPAFLLVFAGFPSFTSHISTHNGGQWKLLSWRGGVPLVEIRVSFIIPYKPPSQLPGTNSKGNGMANPQDRLYYRHQ